MSAPALAAPDAPPRWRGRLHAGAFVVSLPAGAALVAGAGSGKARVALLVYSLSISTMFGVSALFHLGHWSPAVRHRLGRLDHSSIFLAIAGTYTPFSLLALRPPLGLVVLTVVWSGALSGIVLRLAWSSKRRPRWALVASYVALGWVGVVAFPQLVSVLGVSGFGLVLLGGVCYTAGALVYARRRPDPVPSVFGYHEVFHALVVAGAALQYAAAAWFIPRGGAL